jgi:hypothetical protein
MLSDFFDLDLRFFEAKIFNLVSQKMGATTLIITTFGIMTLSIKGLLVTLSINAIQHIRH